MELSDYDILGITPKATFREVKNAYHDLSRIYHPDSLQLISGITKDERIIAFTRIQSSYENIKKKLNVTEVDLPQTDIGYELPTIQRNNELTSDTISEFNKKFNSIFEQIHKDENIDEPYSIHYKEPEEKNRNLNDSGLIIAPVEYRTGEYEFGVNYVNDHSSDNYSDIRNLKDAPINNNVDKDTCNENKTDLNEKIGKLIESRKEKIVLDEHELDYIDRQERIRVEIQESKRKVVENRDIVFLN